MLIDIYCRVIDNYGDAGVCLRLARLLKQAGVQVHLFCDDLNVLRTIALPDDDDGHKLSFLPFEAEVDYHADAVVEAFLCHLPPGRAAAVQADHTLVICLDYLSAESWVEDFHGLRSPGQFADCYYFYPGFTAHTGGLMLDLQLRQAAAQPHIYAADGVRRASLFSYHNKALPGLVELLQRSALPTEITVFSGLPLDNVNALYDFALQPGDSRQLGLVTFKAAGMSSQQDYDRILCRSDLNLVRGEDSIVRAACCGRPFLWQIYPQDKDAHLVKLRAFLQLIRDHAAGGDGGEENLLQTAEKLQELMLFYNERGALPALNFDRFEQEWRELCSKFRQYLNTLPLLSQSLITFVQQHCPRRAD